MNSESKDISIVTAEAGAKPAVPDGQQIYRRFLSLHQKAKLSRAELQEYVALAAENRWLVSSREFTRNLALEVVRTVDNPNKLLAWFGQMYDNLLTDLGHPNAPYAERLMIELVALNWMRSMMCEMACSTDIRKPSSLAVAQFEEKRLSVAQRRYLKSVETLAKLRRLRLPAIQAQQVNIAAHGQQVNAVGMGQRTRRGRRALARNEYGTPCAGPEPRNTPGGR